MNRSLAALLLLGVAGAVASPAAAQLGRVELLAGLEAGLLRAEFRGNGESSVLGRIWAVPGGPTEVTVQPGTQFWAQLGGGGRGGNLGGIGGGNQGNMAQRGGGRQGMGALGQADLDLGPDRFVQAILPTACTNLGLPAPTRRDVMIPTRCPDARVVAVAARYGELGIPRSACQLAVWAITDNPSRRALDTYLTRALRAEKKGDAASELTPDGLLALAGQLLREAGLEPQGFALFR